MRGCQKKSSVHAKNRNQPFYSKQNTETNASPPPPPPPPDDEQASGALAGLAGTWLFVRTLLRSSCILEKRRTQSCMFLFSGRAGESEREGLTSPISSPPPAPNRASSDPEKQPRQEQGCEFMTKQNTLLGGSGWSRVTGTFSFLLVLFVFACVPVFFPALALYFPSLLQSNFL